ncbi:MAG: DinB family protein [Chitinophagales bacterium]
MKKLILLFAPMLIFSFTEMKNTLTAKERESAGKLLTDTENAVFDAVRGLSEAQLHFKPAPDRWSVEECVKHIAISEQNLWKMIDGGLKQPANPEKRADIKMTDDQVVQMLENRTRKVKTSDALKPENTPFKSLDEALSSFKANRNKLIDYVKSTDDDLRNHVLAMPFGSLDCYQIVLFIGAHSNRHTQQIDEVKADPNYPKN